MNVNDLYKRDFDNLPVEEKAAWKYEHYRKTRDAINKYFVRYGLDVAMIIEMMERAKEADIRYQTMIDIIDNKLLPPYSRELNEFESILASLFDEVLRPLPDENIVESNTDKFLRLLRKLFWSNRRK